MKKEKKFLFKNDLSVLIICIPAVDKIVFKATLQEYLK